MKSKINRTSKKAICLILSLTIAFGTFVTITFGSSMFQKWFGVRTMLSAYAAEFVDTKGVVAVNEESMLADDHTINLENKDGSNTVYLFSEPISFTDKNGNLRTKDLSVEKANSSLKDNGYDYTNGQNDYRINFSKDKENGVQVEYKNSSFKIAPQSIIDVEGQESVAEYLSENFEVFQYKNIYGNGTNLRYYPQLNGLKDEIVLNQNINKNAFSFNLTTDNCNARLTEEGTITLVDSNSNILYTFEVPYAYDSEYVEGERNEHISNGYYTLSDNGNSNYVLTININKSWLESKNTVYPVIIDPTTSHLEQNKDVSAYSSHPNTNYGTDKTLSFGKTTANGKGRVYTHFHIPEEIANYATINSAAQWEREVTGETSSMGVSAYLVETEWDSTTLTWNNKPSYNSNIKTPQKNINSASTDKPNYPLWYKFDIKNILQSIVGKDDVNLKNYGMVFVAVCETNSNERWRTFAARNYSSSAYRPYTVINYTNDTTAPTVGYNYTPNTWTNGNVTLNINDSSYNDTGGSGKSATPYSFSSVSGSYSWKTQTSYSISKNGTYYLCVRDKAHNIRTYTITISNIDKLAPESPELTGVPEEWVNHNVTITAFAEDEEGNSSYGESGVNEYSFSTNENVTNFTSSNSKTYTEYSNIFVYSKDAAGNISEDCEEAEILIDKDAPSFETVIEYNETTGKYDVTVEAEDINGNYDECSGIAGYRINSNEDWENSEEDSHTFVNIDNPNSLQIAVKDNAGNITTGSPEILSPIIYQDGNHVKIINPNHHNLRIQYKVNNGNFVDYTEPIELEANVETTIEARFYGTDISETEAFTNVPSSETVPYEEETTDLTIENNETSFDISRRYNSNENEWHFSTESSVNVVEENYVYSVILPNEEPMIFALNEDFEIENEDTGYTLTVDNDNSQYIVDCDDIIYCYDITNGRLKKVSNNRHSIDFSYTSGALTRITTTEGTASHSYSISESNGKINYIITPIGEKLVYQYSGDGLVKVYYDKDTLQFGRSDNIIIGEYEYDDNKLFKTNGNTVTHDENGNYVSIITTWNETVENEPETTQTETETEAEATNPEPETQPEPTYTYFDGTQTVHTETTNYTNGNITYTTVNEYNIDSQLTKITETETETNGAGGTTVVCTKITEYEYFENSDDTQTETITETVGTETTEAETTYNQNGNTVSESVTQNGQTTLTQFTYDDFGNNISVTVSVGGNVNSETVYEYDALNRCIKETQNVPNESAEVTLYAYNPLGEILYEKYGNEVTRTMYDKYNRVIQKIEPQDYSASDDGISLNTSGYPEGSDSYSNSSVGTRYVYDSSTRLLIKETNRLNVVTDYTYHTDSSVVATEVFDIYRYEYNTDGNLTDIFVANTTPAYAHYVYDTDKNNTEIQYGNGQTVYYSYDSNKNVTAQSYTGINETTPVTQFTYTYNTDNKLTSKTDCLNHRCTDYSGNTVSVYDISGNSDVLLYSYTNTEEDANTNTPSTAQKNYAGNTLDVTYGENSNQYELNNNDVFTVNSTYTNNQLSSTIVNNPSNQAVVSKSFTYDNDNNVTGLTVNNTQISYVYDNDKITEYHQGSNAVYYHYDNKDQLVREDINYSNYSRTITYTYDTRGNLTEKKEYSYTRNESPGTPLETNDLEFEYEDELWLDEIVTTPTETILYDENGNPVNLEDCTLEWTNGRQLKSVSNGNDIILEYTYDDNGIRTSKTYQGETTYYCTENGIITSQYQLDSQGNKENEVIFIYDNGSLVSAYYDNAMYYYITNAMGDVISIIDESGNTVIDYCYDAWGNVVDKVANAALTCNFAEVNPMLYRSYYYDEDLGVYYLQSRYYKSDWCRFINSDLPTYAKNSKNEFIGLNLFVYCCNEPVYHSDPTGNKRKTKRQKIQDLLSDFKENFVIKKAGKLGKIEINLLTNNFYKNIYKALKISKNKTYNILREYATNSFKDFFGRDIVFNDKCVKKEIEYHVRGYLGSLPQYEDDVSIPTAFIAFALSEYNKHGYTLQQSLISHCAIIDISEADVYNSQQKKVFKYYKRIRKKYKKTKNDPYFNSNKKKRSKSFINKEWGNYEIKA